MLLTSGCKFYRTYGTHYSVPYPQSIDHKHHNVHTVAAPLLVLPYKQKCTLLCYSYQAYSYTQYINQPVHLIKYIS